ncbi:hypothetical protein [Actinosynnema pretiosum]|uniref:Uncharacterized protein n=1 Tax=Actinosynnema pretiosum TaxID=42197 RepID=A0A290Z538_9PSEU|nr:hypothetical protein [Actinosynnema pretiosum]ATE54161.1 hypothetical protein CNX65_13395 [Actinosynnema pretiosum]
MSPFWAVTIALVGSVLLTGALVGLALRARRGERAELLRQVREHGWEFRERDDRWVGVHHELERHVPLEPVLLGPQPVVRARRAKDVLTGEHRGRRFALIRFAVTRRENTSRTRWVDERDLWVRLPVPRPTLRVARGTALSNRINAAIAPGVFLLGCPEFDREYQVTCFDEAFARAVLTPEVVAHLLGTGHRGFWVRGSWLGGFPSYRELRDVAGVLDACCDLLDTIPRHVWS